ncbi:hypothetical protein DB354_19230 [Opitutus sp. ER46]|nr:hypothetical protein DB354_19230 [Opitutus sp. ER46]
MIRTAKDKPAADRQPVRRTPSSASAAARQSFPVWVDAGETPTTQPSARGATPRVRAGLVLRSVSKDQSVERSVPHGSRSR